MKMVLIAPRKYVQGRGVLAEIGPYLKMLGQRPLVLWDGMVRGLLGDTVLQSVDAAGLEAIEATFGGEATREEGQRIAQLAREQHADVVAGIGGGKAIDVAKAAAWGAGLKLMTVPTIAATDAPTSAATVWYDAEANFLSFECWPFNPDIVLVDTQVIAHGPPRAFAAGMGDALSTWVEAEAAYKSRAANIAGGVTTQAALAIARLGFELLMEYGVEALRAVRQKVVTPAVEKIVEANVLHSGLGFESGGLATAHMIANPLSNYPECKGFMHGEKVSFGIVTQLCLDEDVKTSEMNRIVDFLIAVGLPVTFADLNLHQVTRDRLRAIGEACAGPGSLCHNHCFQVTVDDAIDAMLAADAVGRARKAAAKID
ncbi:MAG: glycerol dehydrogenase [Candidatus Anammoximicrobium sp.]|nr:glycerol dehydrogenase [Candidatus Anammoximicrobium sp.]